METYADILKQVKELNPELSFKDAQKAASKIFREKKEAEVLIEEAKHPNPIKQNKKYINPDVVESAIRHEGVNKHNIVLVARRFDPDFSMYIHGKEGVNTLVYLDGPCRVPASGYFKIWI